MPPSISIAYITIPLPPIWPKDDVSLPTRGNEILGYKDYRKIEFFINDGFLKAYKMPHTKRIKVRYHDVMNLPIVNQ